MKNIEFIIDVSYIGMFNFPFRNAISNKAAIHIRIPSLGRITSP